MKKQKKLQGIGGWLLFYTILYVLGLLSLIISVGRAMILGKYITFFFLAIFLLFDFYVFSLLLLKKKKAIKWNIFLLWFSLIWLYIIEFANLPSSIWVSLSSRELILASMNIFIGLIINMVFAILWILYWKKSKRVRNTFKK